MGSTSTYDLPYPGNTDGPDGPTQIEDLAEAVDTALGGLQDNIDSGDLRPFCFLEQGSTGTSVPSGTFTAMSWDTDVVDDSGMHNPASNPTRITPTKAGWYQTFGKVAFVSDTGGVGRRGSGVALNGTLVDQTLYQAPSGGAPYAAVPNILVFCNGTTDYLELKAFQDSGATRTTISGSAQETRCRFGVQYVGP